MKRILSLLLAAVSCEAKSIVTEDLVHKIAVIESNCNPDAIGDNGASRGAFQIQERAWADAVAYHRITAEDHDYPIYTDWKTYSMEYELSFIVARTLLKMHEERMRKAGIKVTPIRLYMAYNMGYSQAKQFHFNPASTYGLRRAILIRAERILSK